MTQNVPNPIPKQIGTSSHENGFGCALDSNGNIYITGNTFGGMDGNSNAGGSDIYISKYNNSGSLQWTRQEGTSSNEQGNKIAIDSSDNIFITAVEPITEYMPKTRVSDNGEEYY